MKYLSEVMPCILVIDDRMDVRLSVNVLLSDNHFQVIEADNPQVAQMMLKSHQVELILLDMNYSLDTTSGEEGLSFLRWLQNTENNMPVVAMTAWSNVDIVVQAMQLGAVDFIEKPWKNKRLLQIINQQLAFHELQNQNTKLKQQLHSTNKAQFIWRSDCMTQLMQQINTVADTEVNILLTGENGTGKSELANYIHQQSGRRNEAFVAVNMGAISESLFESEMFGHKKGAFTDAKQQRIGRFELAEKGTLFLDEIVNIPFNQQHKLLRVLESGDYEMLGSSHTQRANIRLVSATNGNISQLIQQNEFREDLYYRLNTLEFHVPNLVQRTADIIPLAEFFIQYFSRKYQRGEFTLATTAKNALQAYHWPGNIREMSHLIERAVLLTRTSEIDVDNLHLAIKHSTNHLPMMTLEQAERQLIAMALAQSNNQVFAAAKLLGLTKSSLYRRLEKYEISF